MGPVPSEDCLPSSDLRDQLQATLSGSYTLERELGRGWMSRASVELWKSADPELKLCVAEARRRLIKLTPIEKPR